jgi:alanine dehydrogenase
MRIGVPREIKDREGRVAVTPEGAAELVRSGHRVLVEAGAGAGAGFGDASYAAAGATLVGPRQAWEAELVVKVKEPLAAEYSLLHGQILFTYLHLAGVDPALTRALLDSGTTALAYETVTDGAGRRPLLAPMSAIAGTMAVMVGSHHLARTSGGRGTLLGQILDERHGKVVVLGDGVVGRHAARAAAGLGAAVCVLGRHPDGARPLAPETGPHVRYRLSKPQVLARELEDTDLLVGAVLVPGARTPELVSEEMVRGMPAGAVIVDVSIDQGGCVATSRPTTHSRPVYVTHGVLHYCVTNMPAAYPRTSTLALAAATLPYLRRLADQGIEALRHDPGLASGLSTAGGWLHNLAVAQALGLAERYRPLA